MAETRWQVAPGEAGLTVTAFLRTRFDRPWSELRRWVATQKVFIDGKAAASDGERVYAGQTVEVRMAAPRAREAAEVRLVFEDAHVVVIDKPAGVSSVPYEAHEQGTAMDLIRDAWRRMKRPATQQALFVVHRIDKDTSGLLAFAKSKPAERAMAGQFRDHSIERTYLCVAHGEVEARRIESFLLDDRGDGLRGSTRHAGQGKRAVTHVRPLETLRGATLCEVKLETGKTHQIRIHLSEAGHPLVGERVYTRDFLRREIPLIDSPRLLLHAATLGFVHPMTSERVALSSEPPEDFSRVVRSLAAPPRR